MLDSSLPDITAIPTHVAIIMDGNGRWAGRRHQPRLFGHRAGVKSVRTVVETAREVGVRYLTLYAFSTENWARPAYEVKGLMALLKNYLRSELQNMLENDIRLGCIGQRQKLPEDVRIVLEQVMAETARCRGMTMNLALSYGSRMEIVDAVRTLAGECEAGRLHSSDISEEKISEYLSTSGQPDPDLLIRTGGEMRLSNFLLWQASYAELYFTDLMWPDFGRDQFLEALVEYGRRQRRFGRTGEQVETS